MRICIIFISSFLFLTISHARDAKSIQAAGTIVFATEGAYAPFNFFTNKKLTGFEVEIAEAVAKSLNLKVEWKTYGFDSLLIGLNQNKYDAVIASHGITADRQKAVDFTLPHYCSGGAILSLENGPKTAKALAGKTIGVQVGTTYLQKAKELKGIKEVKTYPKDTDSLQNLMAKRLDAMITDRFLAMDAVKKHADKVSLSVGELLFVEEVAMVVKKGNQSLREILNQGLKNIKANGDYLEISNKYFSADIGCKS